jgi:hypothetical protein
VAARRPMRSWPWYERATSAQAGRCAGPRLLLQHSCTGSVAGHTHPCTSSTPHLLRYQKPSTHAHLRISVTLHAQAEAAHARVQTLRQQVAELERQVDQEREARAEVDSELEVGHGIEDLGFPGMCLGWCGVFGCLISWDELAAGPRLPAVCCTP